ncbi:hypothetical protein L218DRAFT_175190 [Marasmius fiardii PR-910]|nr:hypothetical protein L218DRAFT_175190 [Marasmius fiardii PR-910]
MPRIPLLDILHRGVVYSLAGLSVWAVVSSVAFMERKEAEERRQREEAMGLVAETVEPEKLKSA